LNVLNQRLGPPVSVTQPKVSNRAIAKALGADEKTVRRDAAANAAPADKKPSNAKGQKAASAANAAPTLTGAAAAKAVEKVEAKEERQAAKEEQRGVDAVRILSLAQVTGKFPTLVIDPPWDYDWLSLTGRALRWYRPLCLLPADISEA
jgi:hypothetical protein